MGNINVLRYMIYCSKRGKYECEQLPPGRSSLVKHISRGNYQTRIWRLSLQSFVEIPDPSLRGWKVFNENGEATIQIDWMDCKPAPDEVLELVPCDCRTNCLPETCSCFDLGMKCTDACRLRNCNFQSDKDEIDYFDEDSVDRCDSNSDDDD